MDALQRFERDSPLEARLPATSIHGLFAASKEKFGDRPAITMILTGEDTETPRTLSYRDLFAGVTRTANLFADLGGPGAGVAYLLPNLIETQLVLWGAQANGYVVPLNFLLRPEQLAELIVASGAKILVALGPHPQLDIWQKALAVRERIPGLTLIRVSPPGAPAIEGVLSLAEALSRHPGDALHFSAPRGDLDIGGYLHTGGTTGSPKLVSLTHRGQIVGAFGMATLLGLNEHDVFPNGLPLFHAGGTVPCSLAPFLVGSHVLMLSPAGLRNPAMVKRMWRIVERYRATLIGGVPTSIAALCEVPVDGDLSSVRLAIVGAAPTPRAVVERFEAHTGKRLHDLLGMTETSGVVAVDPSFGDRTIGSVGFRIPYTEAEVRRLDEGGKLGAVCAPNEVGVLVLRGPHVTPGYKDPTQNAARLNDGWLDTGDLVFLDEAGKLHIAGRSKDLIIRGGHNIDPAMIEEAFLAHPSIAMAAAVGEPDAYAGELPVCYVTLRPGASAVTADDLRLFVEPRIAERPAWPKRIHVLPELPLTAVGKIYKPALRIDATRRVAEEAVQQALGHAPEALVVSPGGDRGARVSVTLSAADAGAREAIAAALGAYLFESTVEIAAEKQGHAASESPSTKPRRQYFAAGTADAFELERLGHLQQMLNPITFRRLEKLGVAKGWRCLDMGAGEGSVARWLAERVGPEGRVVAADLHPRFLVGIEEPNIEVRAHDILAADLEPGAYDLVHCRALLMHLPDPRKALERMIAAVKPGGWICIEEGDYGSWEAIDHDSVDGACFRRTFQAALGLKMDYRFGRRTRSLLEAARLTDIGHDGATTVSHGEEPGAHFHRMSAAVLRKPAVAAGAATDADFDVLERAFRDPSFGFVSVTLFGAWGRRPE
ncbi:MAG: AMP-binding protein [Polyangiaceae bacterium]